MLRRLFNFKQNSTIDQLLLLDACYEINAIHLKELESMMVLYIEQYHALELDLQEDYNV